MVEKGKFTMKSDLAGNSSTTCLPHLCSESDVVCFGVGYVYLTTKIEHLSKKANCSLI